MGERRERERREKPAICEATIGYTFTSTVGTFTFVA